MCGKKYDNLTLDFVSAVIRTHLLLHLRCCLSILKQMILKKKCTTKCQIIFDKPFFYFKNIFLPFMLVLGMNSWRPQNRYVLWIPSHVMPTARTSCGIKNIVYLLTYPCQSAYIIKTNLELKARFSERNINTDGCSSSFVHWPLSVPLSFKVWQWHFLLWGGDRDRVLFCVCSLQTDSTVCSV